MSETLKLIRQKAWNSRHYSLPERLGVVPTMLTNEEVKMLSWITKYHYRGVGVICDLGSFIGGSTIHLAYGLRESGKPGKVYSYDYFDVSQIGKHKWLYSHGVQPFEDTDVLPLVRAFLSEFLDIVELRKGNVTETSPPQCPIEICFIDIAKTMQVNEHIARQYFTKLIPGQSIVIQQDYLWIFPPWDIATMEILSDHFELLSFTEEGSVIFLCTKEITNTDADRVSMKALKNENLAEWIRRAKRRFPYWRQKEILELAALAYEYNPDKMRSGNPKWRSNHSKQLYEQACRRGPLNEFD